MLRVLKKPWRMKWAGLEGMSKETKDGERSTQRCMPGSFQQEQGSDKSVLITLANVGSARNLKTRTQALWVALSSEFHVSASGNLERTHR